MVKVVQRKKSLVQYDDSARMRVAEEILRPTTKARFGVTPDPVRTKGFVFPRPCYIERPVTQAMSKTLRMVAVAGAYFIAGKLGLLLANVHASVSPVWPATGVALAALLVWGIDLWRVVFIGAFLVNITAALPADTSIFLRIIQAFGIAGGNTLEAVTAVWLVNHFAGGRAAFQKVANVFRYTFLAGSVSTAVSATIGTLTLLACGLLHGHMYPATWLTWWLGDMIGAAVVAPLILLWGANPESAPGYEPRDGSFVAVDFNPDDLCAQFFGPVSVRRETLSAHIFFPPVYPVGGVAI